MSTLPADKFAELLQRAASSMTAARPPFPPTGDLTAFVDYIAPFLADAIRQFDPPLHFATEADEAKIRLDEAWDAVVDRVGRLLAP